MMIRLRWVDLLTLRWVPVAFVLVGNTRTSTASGSDMICFETTNPYAAYQENPTCTNAIRHPPPPPPRPDCNLYMAESTIPGAGLGLFTAIPRNKGDSLHNDEVYIPILDLSWHQGKINGDYFDTTAAYVWNTYSDGSGIESEGAWTGGIMAYWPGWGAAINCHFGINNLVASASSSHHGNVHMHRLTNPGAGAYSYYHAQEAFAYRAIPAGGELFRSYGDA